MVSARGSGEDARAPVVLIPVFNDWDCVTVVLERLEAALASCGRRAEVVLIDDASTEPLRTGLSPRGAISSVRCLRLRCNLGHERAICVGLTWAHLNLEPSTVVVMDGDGEDRPEDVPRLLEELEHREGRGVVFAARTRRSENTAFRFFYLLYQILHRLLVGTSIEVGSFSALPSRVLASLVVMPQLWNHYAATVAISRSPWFTIPTQRGARISGRSRLDQVALVVHGFSALSVYSERIAVRVLLASSALSPGVALLAGALFAARWVGGPAVPDWATVALAVLSLALLVALVVFAAFSVLILSTRSRLQFIPIQNCALYVEELRTL
jgi:hypothetical protein